jgi:tetratricopeptide (TPR) repeat protein
MTDGTFKWDALKRKDYFVDYQNLYTFMGVLSQRQLFVNVANALIDAGEKAKALEILDKCQECFPEENYPLDAIPVGFTANDYMVVQMVECYYFLGQKDKARDLGLKLADGLLDSSRFFLEYYDYSTSSYEACHRCLVYLSEVFKKYGDKKLSDKILDSLELLLRVATGDVNPEKGRTEVDTAGVE